MTIPDALRRAFQAGFYRQHELNGLGQPSSPVVRAVARAAATALVLASAGFGAMYAWSTGSEHGVILAALSVLMAVGLEACKPLAVAHALCAIRSLALARGACLAALAVVAIAYSLTAELSLMATTRGDRVAERAAESNVAIKARSRYERANLEIDRLPTARPSSELQSLIDGVLADPRSGGCITLDGPFTREHCPHVADWRAEQARAQRRAELETTMRDAERHMISGPVAKAADPGASALATYLAALGFMIPASALTEWLALIPVLALEVGSALAGVLVQAVSGDNRQSRTAPRIEQDPDTADGSTAAQSERVSSDGKAPVGSGEPVSASTPNKKRRRTRRDDKDGHGGPRSGGRMPANVVELLKARGGRIEGGQRGIGRLLGLSKSRVNEVLHDLAAVGAVILSTSKAGTVVELAAA